MISSKQTMAIRSSYITFYRHSVGNEPACMCTSAPFPQHGKYPQVTNVSQTSRGKAALDTDLTTLRRKDVRRHVTKQFRADVENRRSSAQNGSQHHLVPGTPQFTS